MDSRKFDTIFSVWINVETQEGSCRHCILYPLPRCAHSSFSIAFDPTNLTSLSVHYFYKLQVRDGRGPMGVDWWWWWLACNDDACNL